MHRRHFLTGGLAATASAVGGRAWSAPATDQRLLVIFLRGGYDAMNVVIPTSSDFYYESRPTIAIARPDPANPNAALPLDSDWSLHPALKDSLYPLWAKKQIAFIPFAGTDDMTRSHFETQDHIELGQGAQTRDFDDGFLNRLVQQIGGRAQPMAFTAQLPLSLRGAQRVPNLAIALAGHTGIDDRQRSLIESMWQGSAQGAAVREGFAVHQTVAQDMQASGWQAEMVAASRGAVAPKGFVAEAVRVGGLMRDSFNVGFIDVGGWDTHVNEAIDNGARGQLADKLAALGQGLAGMAQAMGPAWGNTTVVVLSEFGRTFRENGNRGTDHGHGTVYWVLGGAVRGGRIAGEQIVQSPSTLNQNRDDPVLTDYRDLLGGLFRRLWGLQPAQIEAVFPGSRPVDLQLV